MSRTLRFCKVNTLPGIPSEDTMYLYRDEYDRIVVAITDSTGSVIYTTHNTSSITFLIENYINNLINQPGGVAGLDTNGKISHSSITELLSILDLSTYDTESGSGTTAIRSTITSPADGQILTYRNGNWVNEQSNSSGGIVKRIWTGEVPQQTGTTRINETTTVPAITSGTEIISQVITPLSVNSKFIIKFSPWCTINNNGRGVALILFRNNTFLTMGQHVDNSNFFGDVGIDHVDAPGVIVPIEYSIRVGIVNGSGTWYLNRGTVNTYGGDVPASWTITEVISQ